MTLAIFYLFLLCICIQVYFYLYYFPILLFHKDKSTRADTESKVSIIVCAHNEYKNLKTLIPRLLSQEYLEYEIIIVNDRSNDKTSTLETLFKNDKLKFVHINKTPKGFTSKKYALTKGIESAKNEIILLTDADCVPASNLWLKEMSEKNTPQSPIVLGYSPYQRKAGLLNALIRYETIYTGIQYLSAALRGAPYMGVGRNLCYRKNLFNENNGLESHKNITGGDDDLFIKDVADKHEVSIKITQKSQTISTPKHTWKGWFIQKKRHLNAGKHYKTQHKVMIGALNLSHILFYTTFFLLLPAYEEKLLLFALFLGRAILTTITFSLISYKLKDKLQWYLLPILDLIYIVNYIIFGATALFSTTKKWN
ncbi:glycosyltransferase [Cytophagaceae bacterium ABcell3]|nr:glycosyltransferase [Cytophagaceae bacterium ABcell3]